MTGLNVCLVSRGEPGVTGTSRYVAALAPALEEGGCRVTLLSTELAQTRARALAPTRRLGLDPGAFLASYPFWLRWPEADIYHLSAQTYATALLFHPPPGRVVVTVHDIIPYLVRHNRGLTVYRHAVHRLVDHLAVSALRRADRLVADSQWTKATLAHESAARPERVEVVPLGVDGERYHPHPVPPAFCGRYGLTEGPAYVLYVGSEDPRKNLGALLGALAIVRRTRRDALLVKVGAAHHERERVRLRRLAIELGVDGAVRWIGHVPEDDLPSFYNLASVYVQPSLYEGFGLPVLEALACATPVVCSDRSSLREVAPPDCLVEPSPGGLADGMLRALSARPAPPELAARAAAVRHEFTWQRAAERTAAVYAEAVGRA